MAEGRVVRFSDIHGYGFIAPTDGGEDVFVHANLLGGDKYRFIPGALVEFEAVRAERGWKASEVRIVPAEPPAHPDLMPVADPSPTPADDDEVLCDVLTVDALHRELTEAILADVPTLTGGQISALRRSVVRIADRHGWLDG